jgi:hypothetical protein
MSLPSRVGPSCRQYDLRRIETRLWTAELTSLSCIPDATSTVDPLLHTTAMMQLRSHSIELLKMPRRHFARGGFPARVIFKNYFLMETSADPSSRCHGLLKPRVPRSVEAVIPYELSRSTGKHDNDVSHRSARHEHLCSVKDISSASAFCTRAQTVRV